MGKNRYLLLVMGLLVLALALPGIAVGSPQSLVVSSPQLSAAETPEGDSGLTSPEGDSGPTPPEASAPQEISWPDLAVAARSAVLMDAGSGTFLYEQNGHEPLPPASVTKIMTMLLAMEAEDSGKISFQDPVTISPRAASMGGSQMYMEGGEIRTVETLLMGMAMASANDACVAMAEYIGGTEEIFVEMMNRRAEELGMKNTHFVNTNGLPVEGHYTSAYDIAIMSRELLKHEEMKEWLTTWMADVTIGMKGKESVLGLTNTNRLIKLYPGAVGIKTGFTQEAGYCLSGAAEKGDLTLVAVVLNCETTHIRWNETMRLLDYGFATYDNVKVAEKGASFGLVPVEKGEPAQVEALAGDLVRILVKKGEKDSVTFEALLQENLQAPLAAGDPVGELVIRKDGAELERHPLLAAAPADRASLPEFLRRLWNAVLA